MSNCFEQHRDAIYHKCDSDFYKKVNKCCESTFYKVGVLIAIYAPAVLVFFVVLFGGLGLGIYMATFQNDIYYLWIEKGSRLLGERAYTAEHHSGGQTRPAFAVFTAKDYGSTSNVLGAENLPYILGVAESGLAVTTFDEDLGTVGWEDVCDRIPTPPALYGFMRAFDGHGFPCNKYSTFDCFSEGGSFGFDLPAPILTFLAQSSIAQVNPVVGGVPTFGCCQNANPPLVKFLTKAYPNPSQNFSVTDIGTCLGMCAGIPNCVAFDYSIPLETCNFYTPAPSVFFSATTITYNASIPGCLPASLCFAKNPPFKNKYLFQNSFKSLTDDAILQIVGTKSACATWLGVELPSNFYWGGLRRDATGHVLNVPSTEVFFTLKSAANFAIKKCVDRCVNGPNPITGGPSCVAAVKLAFADLGASPTITPPAGSCQAAIVQAAGTTCAANCLYNNTYVIGAMQAQTNASNLYNAYQAAIGAYCYAGINCSAATDPLCGVCATPAGAAGFCNQSSPTHSYCLQAAIGKVPWLGACLQICAGGAAGPCINAALGAAAYCESACVAECQNPSDDATNVALNTLMSWEANYVAVLSNISNNASGPFIVDYFTERSVDDLVNAAGAADEVLIVLGYFAMIVFGCITLTKYDTLQSRCMLGLIGMFLVIFSIVAALGFCAIVGIPFVPTIVQVLPFLALGLGTYDMFVMAFGFHFIPEKTIPAMLGELLKECGPRLLLTCLTNIIVFGIGTGIPLPAVNLFSGAMCIVIFFNFLILVGGFGALIAINAERMRKDKVDCFCCFDARYKSASISAERQDRIPSCALKFAEIMFLWPVQIFVAVAAIVIFAVAMWGATQIQIGLPLQDIVPRDNYAYGFLKVRGTYYGSGESTLITGFRAGVSYNLDHTDPTLMYNLKQLQNQIVKIPNTDTSIPIYSSSWVDQFLFFCGTTAGCANQTFNANDPSITVVGVTGVALTHNKTMLLYPNKTVFPTMLSAFLSSSGGLNIGQFLELSNGTITSAQIPFFQTELNTDQESVNYILATRAVTDACPTPVYPQGTTYDFEEQYIRTKEYLSTGLGYTCIGVLLITSVFLLHPGATLIMFGVICLTIAEVYGFYSFFGLKLNGVSAVNTIMAIGVVVAPVAHITRVFMVTPGPTPKRAEHALAMMTFPMLFSTISTFVGEFPLNFARFPYFKLYFFYQYVIIGVITIVNAFLPLPLLLAYLGPPTISHEVDKQAPAGYEKGGLVEIPGLEESSPGDTSRRDG